ncbi:MAG: TetR family transcriptional regulator, partial [Actinobacteria bacterium]|nr:TetR family transcriptional regulator [Actinomycetota bacterium]
MSSAPRLTPNDWTEAALEAMARTGTTGVNVEQLAKSLGTTKGSFYHHFKNRQALLDAALGRWEEIVAGDLETSKAVVDPYARLITSSIAGVEGGLNGFVDLA